MGNVPVPVPNPTPQDRVETYTPTPAGEVEPRTPSGSATPFDTRHAQITWAYTYQRADGNRWAEGKGNILNSEPLAIQLEGVPLWLLGFETRDGSIWVAWLETGGAVGVEVSGDRIGFAERPLLHLLPGQPPMGFMIDERLPELIPGYNAVSPYSHPIPMPNSPNYFGVASDGALFVGSPDGSQIERHMIRALPDARLVQDQLGRIATLSQATDRYAHGVLGDGLEAGAFSIVEWVNDQAKILTILLPDELVIEGIAPIWTDLNQDGASELLVTLSHAAQGAQLAIFDPTGALLAVSDPIGRGFRWRHQIAAAPVGPGGSLEIVSVLTPHIGGVVQFHRWINGQLELAAQIAGYSSHALGSRNLDMAVVGDFDGNGVPETVVPDQARSALAGVQRNMDDVEEAWRFPLETTLTTNLATLTDKNNQLWLAAGTASGRIWIWAPKR